MTHFFDKNRSMCWEVEQSFSAAKCNLYGELSRMAHSYPETNTTTRYFGNNMEKEYLPDGMQRTTYYLYAGSELIGLYIHHFKPRLVIGTDRVVDGEESKPPATGPLVGMFLSPDPYIQAPGNWLNYNRYSYCLNNPLMYTDPSGEMFVIDDMLMMVIMGAVSNAAVQMGSGNVRNAGDLFKSLGVGALSSLAGSGASGLVASGLKVGGFLGGGLAGMAGGIAGGFAAGAGNAWANGADFKQGLRSGLISGGIGGAVGGLLGGLQRGFADRANGYSFWNGSRIDEIAVGEDFINNARAYGNNSTPSGSNDMLLKTRLEKEYGITKGNYGIKKIGTIPGKGYGLSDDGLYVNLKTGEYVGGYARSSTAGSCNLHISPAATLSDNVSFKAISGHELIHAYHNNLFKSSHSRLFSERVAYQYSAATLWHGGKIGDSMNMFFNSVKLRFWGTAPSSYSNIPFIR